MKLRNQNVLQKDGIIRVERDGRIRPIIRRLGKNVGIGGKTGNRSELDHVIRCCTGCEICDCVISIALIEDECIIATSTKEQVISSPTGERIVSAVTNVRTN